MAGDDKPSQSRSGSPTKSPPRKKKARKSINRAKNEGVAPYKFTSVFYETHKSSVYGAAFNPYIGHQENDYLATCGNRFVNIYKLIEGDKRIDNVLQFQDPNKEECYYAVCWAIDEVLKRHMVVVGGAKGIIRVVDVLFKETANTLRGHGESVNELRTSPSYSMIVASASKDRTARLWNIRNCDCLAIFGGAFGHLDEVISVDFDQQLRFLLTTSMDHTVRIWDMRKGTESAERLVQSMDNTKTVDLQREPAVENHFPLAMARDVHTNYVDCGRFFGSFILTKSCENMICLWKFGGFDLPACGEGTLHRTETYSMHTCWLELPQAETWFIKFDVRSDNKFLACGNEAGEVHLWNLELLDIPCKDERPSDFVLTTPDAGNCVRQIVFSPNGRILVSVGDSGHVARFDLQKA